MDQTDNTDECADDGDFAPKKEHISVMPDEVMEWLDPQPGETYLDGTLGLAGHSLMVSKVLGEGGWVIGLDRDSNALAKAGEVLQAAPCKVDLRHSCYSLMDKELAAMGVESVDRILLDIGVSSMQLDRAERGFSFMREGPLDMRMDDTAALTAEKIVMTYPEQELKRIFWEYGEERFSGKVAALIVNERKKKTINTTTMLADIVSEVIFRRGKIHPATRVFQALRIAVNDELGELERGIEAAVKSLRPGGRLVIITFHSLEDRLAKQRFRDLVEQKVVTLPKRKVVKPTYEECCRNRRSRSAKLRVLEKL